MNFELRNFGKISKANVKLDGITVICGNNNTGKSTVGKALFSFYNSLYDYKARIAEYKLSEIRNYISKFSDMRVNDISEETITKGKNFLETYLNKDVIAEIENKYSISEDKILSELVYRYFDLIMNKEVARKRKRTTTKECVVKAIFKGNIIDELKFTDQKWHCNISEPIAHKAYYINSPYVLDYLNNQEIDISSLSMLERNVIEAIQKAQAQLKANSMSNILDAVSNKDDLSEVMKVLENAYDGETHIDNGLYVYKEKNGIQIDFRNISAGLKAFALIERLLKGGVLKKKDVLILDEPEIHLHSEWQIYYAELIVALQKKFDLTILLVTHSFQFLESLNFFMKKYEISDRGNYYIPEERNDGYVMKSYGKNPDELKLNLVKGSVKLANDIFDYEMKQVDFDDETWTDEETQVSCDET